MKDFYEKYYTAMKSSAAHAEFCERVFGKNLCQHGFADMAQLDLLLEVTGLRPGQRALDLGCGNGLITEYLSDESGAHITGLEAFQAAGGETPPAQPARAGDYRGRAPANRTRSAARAGR